MPLVGHAGNFCGIFYVQDRAPQQATLHQAFHPIHELGYIW
jgi:hypothetical protein